jgi:hypothetical protein
MSVEEKIIKRKGNVEDRRKANKALGVVGALQGEYKTSKEKARQCKADLDLHTERLRKTQSSLALKRNKLSEIQEVIDADYLPEGAQPVARIQGRDALRLVCYQICGLF